MKDLNDFIGIEFLNRGRSFTHCDCYGLVMLYFKEILGITIPDVIASPKQPKMSHLEYLDNISKHWEELNYPDENFVVALSTHPSHPNLVTHFGVVVKVDGRLKMLHTFKDTKSHLVDLDNPAYKPRIKAYYKWLN